MQYNRTLVLKRDVPFKIVLFLLFRFSLLQENAEF